MPEILVEPKVELTTAEIQSEEARLLGENPFRLVEHGFLTIKTKSRGIIKLFPNNIQQRFIKEVKKIFFSGKPVRVIVLKARQMGISTIIEGIIYAFVSRMKGVNACVVADDLDGANYIFEMQKLFQEMLEKHLKPNIKHSNEKKLSFNGINSQIVIDTADNPNVGRKYTFQFAHLTEVGRWQKSLNELLAGLGHAIPNSMGTMVFLESTAKGYNEFYDLWVKAINGGTDWIPVFLPWWEFPEYQLALESGKLYPIDNIKFVTPVEKENFLKEEQDIKKKYNLSDEQLNWRRWDIVNNCSGEVNKFRQENPACWEEAFVASGDIYFNREALQAQPIKKPLVVGNIVKDGIRYVF
ncbi:MAG: hypothetical protein IMZ53_11765, partial [Thermoplasmata archaeon]|nr:hypothetical protein [Thermoplasmata archaeon]